MPTDSENGDKQRALQLYEAVKAWNPSLISYWNTLARKPLLSDDDEDDLRKEIMLIKNKIFLFLRQEGYVSSFAEAQDDLIRIDTLVAVEDGRMISPFLEYLR